MSNFAHKFWLISVFVTNAKGGDCWNYDIFVISANTYSILNAYLAHHLVYSVYQVLKVNKGLNVYRVLKLNEGLGVYRVKKVNEGLNV